MYVTEIRNEFPKCRIFQENTTSNINWYVVDSSGVLFSVETNGSGTTITSINKLFEQR